MSFNLVPFESSGVVCYSPSIVTMAISLTIYEIVNPFCIQWVRSSFAKSKVLAKSLRLKA